MRPGVAPLPVEASVGRRHLFLTRSSSRRLLTVGHALGILLLALPRSASFPQRPLVLSLVRPLALSLARPSLPFPGPHSARTRKIEQKSSKSGGVTEFVCGWLSSVRSAREEGSRGGECDRSVPHRCRRSLFPSPAVSLSRSFLLCTSAARPRSSPPECDGRRRRRHRSRVGRRGDWRTRGRRTDRVSELALVLLPPSLPSLFTSLLSSGCSGSRHC